MHFSSVEIKIGKSALSSLINTKEERSYGDKRVVNANFELALTFPFPPWLPPASLKEILIKSVLFFIYGK